MNPNAVDRVALTSADDEYDAGGPHEGDVLEWPLPIADDDH